MSCEGEPWKPPFHVWKIDRSHVSRGVERRLASLTSRLSEYEILAVGETQDERPECDAIELSQRPLERPVGQMLEDVRREDAVEAAVGKREGVRPPFDRRRADMPQRFVCHVQSGYVAAPVEEHVRDDAIAAPCVEDRTGRR